MKKHLERAEIENELVEAFAEEYRSRKNEDENVLLDDVVDSAIETVSLSRDIEEIEQIADELFTEDTLEDLVTDILFSDDPYHNPLSNLGLSEKDFL